MRELHNTVEYSKQSKPEGGLRATLCSNEVLSRSSPLGFNNTISEDNAIEYLAEILVDAFLDKKKNNANKLTKESGIVCKSIN